MNNSIFIKRYKEYSRTVILIVIFQEHVQAWIDALEALAKGTVHKVTLHDSASNIYIASIQQRDTKGLTLDYNSQINRYILDFSKDQLESCISYYKECCFDNIMKNCHLDIESEQSLYDICFTYTK